MSERRLVAVDKLGESRVVAGGTPRAARLAMRQLIVIIAAIGGCANSGDDSPSVYIPRLDYPADVTVDKGASTSFVLSLGEQADANGMFYPYNAAVTVLPGDFGLSPSNPFEAFVISAVDDGNSMDEFTDMDLYIFGAIGGDSPTMGVYLFDKNAEHIVPSTSSITMAASTTATFGVQLSQPLTAPVTVTLSADDGQLIDVTPTTLVFGVADYDVLQTVTVTSRATGSTEIVLDSPDIVGILPSAGVDVTVQAAS